MKMEITESKIRVSFFFGRKICASLSWY